MTKRSRFLPRTRSGRMATIAFAALFVLALPPFTHSVLNRIELPLFGVPFLYIALLAIYSALICVLIWAYRRGV